MKKLMLVSFVLALISTIALAQQQSGSQSSNDQSQSGSSAQSGSQSSQQNPDQSSSQSQDTSKSDHKGKKQKASGTVSNNGQTFTSDQNNKAYTVSNPDALQSYNGQHVQVIMAVDPDTNTIHIIQLVPQGQ